MAPATAPAAGPGRSERPAASPAHAAAGRAARETASADGTDGVGITPSRREDRFLRALRKRAELVREARQREITAAHVPGRRRDLETLEIEDPALGDAERNRPRKPPVEGVGRQAREPILLRALEELLEAAHVRQLLHAEPGLVRHDPAPADEDQTAEDGPEAQPRIVEAEPGRSPGRQHEAGHRRDGAREPPPGAHAARRSGEEPGLDHQTVAPVADRR